MIYYIYKTNIFTADDSAKAYHKFSNNFDDRFKSLVILNELQINFYKTYPNATPLEVFNTKLTEIERKLLLYKGKLNIVVPKDRVVIHKGAMYYLFYSNEVLPEGAPYITFNSISEYESFLLQKIVAYNINYDWANGKIKILCDNGRCYESNCSSVWTEYEIINFLKTVDVDDCPCIVLPSDIAASLLETGYVFKKVCYSDAFIYRCVDIDFKGNSVMTSYLNLIPIDFNAINANDTYIINALKNDWDSNNPERNLPEKIVFSSRFEMYNYFKDLK